MKNIKFWGVFTLVILTAFSLIAPLQVSADAIEGETVVTLGKDLTGTQRDQILNEMGVDPNGNAVKVIEVTNQEEHQYLGSYLSKDVIGQRAISSAKITLTSSNKGISVKTNNITTITPSMYANAAITAGIKDADIYVTAPFKVSGTAGLTGIIKAFETATGQKIDENKKQVANEEIVRTQDLSQQIGDPNKAVQFINEVKKQISEEKPKNPEEFRDIIINVSNDFNINLNEQTINEMTQFAQHFSELGIDWDQISQQFENLRGDIKNILDSEKTQGIIDTIFEWLGELFDSIGELFTSASSRQ
ncbi:DUF1002 domain-containing protein [Thermoactinomyces mirandus]|uniref:DUF1002 domain-containing protein n=1 Tax=Thermoactinomyces mirandus TaxID=2756294 RepID=A0A7W1XR12_9BACL|nr:DUF1002 domain-containing protein [Thermoactinomyces mirandus]MBA4601704.1 DUF1002 domain-containing protein [Thermoactinomyces mirandus]